MTTIDLQENLEFVNFEDVEVLNGRLYFPNKSTFQSFYSNLKEKEEYEIADILESKFYSKDFYSLKPIVNDKTEQSQVQRHLSKIKNNKTGLKYKTTVPDEELIDNFDDLEDIFGEDVFASFLNQEAELQVADEIYKYTDTGLFIAKEEDIENLNSYLDEEQISKNLLEPTAEPIRESYIQEYNPTGGTVEVNDFEYFLPEKEAISEINNNVVSTINNSTSNNSDEIEEILKNIDICSGTKPFIANLFGKTKVCIDKYESKRRVKVKYYNVDLKLAYSIGVKVKHQYKGWTGIWRKQDTDEMTLGINSITWTFDHTKLIPKNSRSYPTRFYTYDGELYETVEGYYDAVYIGRDKPMPPLPFAKKLDVVVEFVTDGYTPLETEYEVREFFYETLYGITKNLMSNYRKRELKRIGVIINVDKKTWVQYYDFDKQCSDCDKLETVFDWGVATPAISYTFDSPSGFGWDNFELEFDMDFRKPSNTGVNLYGIAKRNGEWHGKRMVW
jgi:hypothetical protein